MPAQRIDFKFIRDHADIAKLLAHYGVALIKDGGKDNQFKALCPFHDDHKPSLKVNTGRNIYHCFVCDAGGNVIDLVMRLDDLDIRSAAKRVAEICAIATSGGSQERRPAAKPRSRRRSEIDPPSESESEVGSPGLETEPEAPDGLPYNRPLTFTLKNLVTDHPFIAERGISNAIRELFGLGVATRGIMKDRLVFPIHNGAGDLVAYCGRYAANAVPDDVPKYLLPPKFQKELELFNWHRVAARDEPLVLVESYFSVVKLQELGYRCVSPMGRSLSEAQMKLLSAARVADIVLLFDGDDPGRAATTIVGRALLDAGFAVTAPVVPEPFKPHRATPSELEELLPR